MMDEEIDVGEEMVEEMGIDPAASVDDRQRYELLREWHKEPEPEEGEPVEEE